MTQKFYLRNTANNSHPATEQSATEPVAAQSAGPPFFKDLLAAKGAAGTTGTTSGVPNTTSPLNCCLGVFSSVPLAAGTYGSGNWTLAIQSTESDTNYNQSHTNASIYFWRPSNSSVVGYVSDADTANGVELGNNTTSRYGQVLTVAGSNATIQNGDVLVIELWTKGTPSMGGTGRTFSIFYDGTTDVTAAYSGTDPASYLNAPASIPLYVTGAPTITGSGTVAATGTVTRFGTAALTGSGTIAATGTVKRSGTASITGSGAIATTGTRTRLGSVTMSGSGAISADGDAEAGFATVTGDAALSGSGSIAATGTRTRIGTDAITGNGAIAATGTVTRYGSANLSGSATMAASGARTVSGSAQLSGTGALTIAGVRTVLAAATITATGIIAATCPQEVAGDASILGTGSIYAEPYFPPIQFFGDPPAPADFTEAVRHMKFARGDY